MRRAMLKTWPTAARCVDEMLESGFIERIAAAAAANRQE